MCQQYWRGFTLFKYIKYQLKKKPYKRQTNTGIRIRKEHFKKVPWYAS